MKLRYYFAGALLIGTLIPVQGAEYTRRASMRGGGNGDSGKCTIEVEVDAVAEVQISGDMGRLRNLSGQPATWRRFECTGPLPSRPGDFRFRGIDGRGNVQLVRDPRENRGVAVVRIDDSKGGREGYTFDLEWRGGSGGWMDDGRGGPGVGPGPRGPYGRDDARGGYGRDDNRGGFGRDRAGVQRAVAICEDAVRAKADRDFGYRDVDFRGVDLDNNPGRNDWIVGGFEGRRGGRREFMRFSCSVDFSSGRVRSVDIDRNDRRR